MPDTLILAASSDEISSFLDRLDLDEEILGKPVYFGDGFKLAITGVGRTNTALTGSALLQKFNFDDILNVGFGGAFPGSELDIGDLVMGSRAIHGDLGIEDPDGFSGIEDIGYESAPGVYNIFQLSPLDLDIDMVDIASVSMVSANNERAVEVRDRFDADVETMETSAAAHLGNVYGMNVSALLVISNKAGSEREFNAELAEKRLSEKLIDLYL